MSLESTKPKDSRLASLDQEVNALVHTYQAIKTPRTVIHLSKTPGYWELFNHVFEYHIGLIKTRSQDFEDGQITVYDKALLILTDNGNSLSHFGAMELFKDEILGIRNDNDMGKLDALFSKNIALRAILGHVTGWRKETVLENIQDDATTPVFESKQSSSQKYPISHAMTSLNAITRKIELAEKWTYLATAQSENLYRKNPAKVRDSAEVLLRHYRDYDPTNHMVPEVKKALRMAEAEIADANRGKKRSFDVSDKGSVDHRSSRSSTPVATAPVSRTRRRRRGIRERADCYRP
ncbi:hypothetical protein MGYG_09082 [Nannizzia gypsea CBS 118893]|uniref:Uncharacterized protein n=1 Tax=Arthroderma gypseum (strain ATCC MYA-4604 / CBS 118893) TaxID=535722 RepID=E4UVS5_ARTGP|nr:hypothetical protein MGYG_09082 [Nannizzia gypsea CBS 118893]EFR02402.1 hypothetical protein MGYG_09082 [Nannizzia gypsea CBS 118893]